MIATYPTIGIARIGHSGDIRDCRCNFVRMGYSDWDMASQVQTTKIDQYSNKANSYTTKTGVYVNSPNKLN